MTVNSRSLVPGHAYVCVHDLPVPTPVFYTERHDGSFRMGRPDVLTDGCLNWFEPGTLLIFVGTEECTENRAFDLIRFKLKFTHGDGELMFISNYMHDELPLITLAQWALRKNTLLSIIDDEMKKLHVNLR